MWRSGLGGFAMLPRYGDADVSFLVPRGNAQMGMLDGKVAIVTGAGNGVGRGEAVSSPTTAPRSSSTTSAAR